MSSEGSQSRNLDVLRAFAVMAVFAGHAIETFATRDTNPFVGSTARFGVMAFFVHTALVLMQSLERMDSGGGGNIAGRFYVRRLFRIYPLSILCVLIVLFFRIPYMPWRGVVPHTSRVIGSNLLLTMDWSGSRPVLAPLWSLPFEVQMYLVLPLCYFLVKKLKWNPLLLWLGGAALFAPVILRETVKYFPCFLAGVIAYVWSGRTRRTLPAFTFPVFVCSVCFLYAYVFTGLTAIATSWKYQPLALLVTDWLCSLAIGLALPFFAEMARNTATRAAHVVAQYSYGIYLSHVPVMWLVLIPLAAQPVLLRVAVLAIGCAGIPIAAYHLLEAPMVNLGKRLTRGRRTVLRGSLAA